MGHTDCIIHARYSTAFEILNIYQAGNYSRWFYCVLQLFLSKGLNKLTQLYGYLAAMLKSNRFRLA